MKFAINVPSNATRRRLLGGDPLCDWNIKRFEYNTKFVVTKTKQTNKKLNSKSFFFSFFFPGTWMIFFAAEWAIPPVPQPRLNGFFGSYKEKGFEIDQLTKRIFFLNHFLPQFDEKDEHNNNKNLLAFWFHGVLRKLLCLLVLYLACGIQGFHLLVLLCQNKILWLCLNETCV